VTHEFHFNPSSPFYPRLPPTSNLINILVHSLTHRDFRAPLMSIPHQYCREPHTRLPQRSEVTSPNSRA